MLSPKTNHYESHYVPQYVQNGTFFWKISVYHYNISTPILIDEFRVLEG
jgi:hypothetical protein